MVMQELVKVQEVPLEIGNILTLLITTQNWIKLLFPRGFMMRFILLIIVQQQKKQLAIAEVIQVWEVTIYIVGVIHRPTEEATILTIS